MANAPFQRSSTSFANNSLLRRLQSSEQELQRVIAEFRELSACSGAEIKDLRDANNSLHSELEASRELCKALEDEKLQSLNVAAEWQKFGRHASSVMQSEVADCRRKVSDLENKQAVILKENLELKELCLYLNNERDLALSKSLDRSTVIRECGDGCSSSSPLVDKPKRLSDDYERGIDEKKPANLLQLPIYEMKQYVRFLEMRVSHLEEENLQLTALNEQRRGNSLHRSNSVSLRSKELRTFAVVAEPTKEVSKLIHSDWQRK